MKKLLLVALTGLALTACGSSGGGSSNNSDPYKNVAESAKSINSVPDELKSEVTQEKMIKLDDGTILNLAEMPLGYLEKNVGNGKIKGINGIYYTFGTWVPHNLKYNEYGLPTNHNLYGQQRAGFYLTPRKDLPKSGVATYEGESLGVATRGKARLEVDFFRNVVSGKIYDRHLDNGRALADITLSNGHITYWGDGATGFAGNAEFLGVSGRFDGNFVGPKAEEAVGRVTKNGEAYVGFGGKRDSLSDVMPFDKTSK